MLERSASWCHRHRWLVLFTWLVAAVALTVAAGSASGAFAEGGRLDGTDSQAAYDLLTKQFPNEAGDSADIVFHDDHGVGADRGVVEAYLAEVAALPRVAEVGPPFQARAPGAPTQVSADGTTAYATLSFTVDGDTSLDATARQIVDGAADLRGDGIQVEFAGGWFTEAKMPASEAVGLLAAVVILLVAFGSVVAMGLPIVTAIIGIVIALAGVGLWANLVDTPDFTGQVASMVGIGVGIDYALFIVTRYRAALQRHSRPEDAVVEAIGTAGRAVAFAGCTVVISLMGMFLMGLPFLYGLAIGTASAVLIAVLAALTLLPALLGFVGRRIDRLSIHRRRRIDAATRESVWHRWSRLVQHRPKAFAAVGLVALLALAAPVTRMHLAHADAGTDPKGSTTREAYDLLAGGFGPGFNGTLVVAAETPDAAAQAKAQRLADAIGATEGVAVASPALPSGDGTAAAISIVPASSPQDAATERLVQHLRDDVIPASGLQAHVGGETASNVDFSALMAARLPLFIGGVLVLSFLLLMAVFRSILVPLKAVVMNLLSIGAAYGVMVMVFQWGWFGTLFQLHGGAPIESWAPMMLFAIVFGLSMDYEVFLLSSVREEYDASHDNGTAVVEGLASTARVITAAAAIMVCVFGSFVMGDLRSIKLIGFGLAAAVLIDATIVRMVLVPATMELLGDRNWWMPQWLDRLVPGLTVERRTPVPATWDAPVTEPVREPVGGGVR
jgi:RND superfamily putative drug exporter